MCMQTKGIGMHSAYGHIKSHYFTYVVVFSKFYTLIQLKKFMLHISNWKKVN